MIYILLFVFGFLLYISVSFRLVVTHPVSVVRYGISDFYEYVRYKQWNVLRTGKLIGYVGLFGKGKTLSAVHDVVEAYNWFNNKPIFDFRRKSGFVNVFLFYLMLT